MVERGHQPDVGAQQHAVAEHVAAHVADAGDREVLALRVDAQFAEVSLDALPRAARGDAHRLVVVAGRSAGGEGVAEPEPVLAGDLVGEVGEGGGALVRGDHEVRVVPVAADHPRWRHGHAAGAVEVVGDVEQARDEPPVAGLPLRAHRLPVGGRVPGRRDGALDHEAPLGTDGDDDGVLHGLGLGEPEDLGAEVLAPVRPAQAAAGNGAEAHVHTLDVGCVDEHLELRSRLGQFVDAGRVELERQDPGGRGVGARERDGPVVAGHEVVGAQRRPDEAEETAQDPVGVEADDGVDPADQFGGGVLLAVGGRLVGVEHRLEQFGEQRGGVRVGEQHTFDVVLTVGETGLPQVLRVGAQHHGLPPAQPGPQDQFVEPVRLREPVPHGGERRGDTGGHPRVGFEVDGQDQAEIVDPAAHPVGADDLVRALVEHLDAEALQHRQHLAEGDALAADVEREAPPARVGAGGPVQQQVDAAVAQCLEAGDVGQRPDGVEVLLVTVGERLRVALHQHGIDGVVGGGQVGEVVVPAAAGLGEQGLDAQAILLGGVDPRQGLSRRGPDGHVQQRQVALRDPGGVVDGTPAVLAHQDLLHRDPDPCVVAVAGQVDQARDEAAVGVDPQEQPQLPAHRDHRGDGLVEGVGVGGEQFHPGQRLQHLEHRLSGEGRQFHAGAGHHLPDPARQHGNVEHVLVQRGHGQHTEEPVLADDATVRAEDGNAHEVRVHRAVHRGRQGRLGEHQQRPVGGLDGRRHVDHVVGGEVGTQHPETTAGHGAGVPRPGGVGDDVVAPVTEDGVVATREPAQQRRRLPQLLRGVPRRRVLGERVEFDGEIAFAGEHRGGVGPDLPHVGEHTADLGADGVEGGLGGGRVQLDVNPRLRDEAVRGRGVGHHLEQASVLVAPDGHDGMDEFADGDAEPGQQRDDGFDEQRHVVGDDLQGGADAPPIAGPVDAGQDGVGTPLAAEVQVGEQGRIGGVEGVRVAAIDVLERGRRKLTAPVRRNPLGCGGLGHGAHSLIRRRKPAAPRTGSGSSLSAAPGVRGESRAGAVSRPSRRRSPRGPPAPRR
ncbi:hypothetical protein AIIKEEIJ_01872 [Rhodococcus sp. YH1]|nr:hypothetical protein [Rhodococcus sp. YH1]